MCVIDLPSSQAICKDAREETPVIKRIPLQNIDKNVCFSPTSWEVIQNYIDDLEDK